MEKFVITRYAINDVESLKDFNDSIDSGYIKVIKSINRVVYAIMNGQRVEFEIDPKLETQTPACVENVINGKDNTSNIVNLSSKGENIHVFRRIEGELTETVVQAKKFVLAHGKPNDTFTKLKGIGYYNYVKYYTPKAFNDVKPNLYKGDYYFNLHTVESYMLSSGMTYFKNMTTKGASILSFDLETTSIDPNKKDAKILCIGSTYRLGTTVIKKMFREDHYAGQRDMLEAWCDWVTEMNPDVITGYNIYLFDINYMIVIAEKCGAVLSLGRDGSNLEFEKRKNPRKIRKDGSQEYDYRRPEVFGREIIDMWIIMMKADQAAKKYDSYALKYIIKTEGLEKADRKHYDAAKIGVDWADPAKRQDICDYCMDDSEDPIKLWDLAITPFFLITAYLPKPFQIVTETNTGGQIDSLIVRSYLQEDWSIPKGSETSEFQGAISYGNPGLYKNAIKWDVSSLYPSIMRSYEIKPASDYLGNFLKMLEYFTLQRIENKKLAKTTGEKYYDDLQGTQKIFINSSYGMLTTPGLRFNDMNAGSSITRYGREVLEKSIVWATGKTYKEWNPPKIEAEKEQTDE